MCDNSDRKESRLRDDNATICLRDVSFSYDGHAKALDGLTFEIERGEFVCVLGGNGSGKSTLARHIDALLLPDEGKVRVFGLDTAMQANLLDIRKGVGVVFQNPDDQIVAAVVEDDVAFGPENIGVPSAELEKRVSEALAKVGLAAFAKHETSTLSGGQKQRVAIAGAYAMEPRVMVFDEAGAMLDPGGRKGLMHLCRQLNDAGITVVMITHFMEEAAAADRVIVLDAGRVAMDGAPALVLTETRRLESLALETPFATQMSMALQDTGVPIETCIGEDELEKQLTEAFAIDKNPLEQRSAGACLRKHADNQDSLKRATDIASSSPPSKSKPIIVFDNVGFSYAPRRALKQDPDDQHDLEQGRATGAAWGDDGGNLWALREVSLTISGGDFLGVAGHTGSGKSTFAQLAAGLLRPTAGTVLVHGHDTADKRTANAIRRSIGMVFQYPEHQLFAKTVHEDVAFGPRNLGLPPEEVERRVHHALDLVHLEPNAIANRNPFELSGGQQRRVALAGVLAMEPDVLILDEPTAGLDPHAHRLFMQLLTELHEANNMATVIVSHDMDMLATLCNRIALLNKGRIVTDDTPRRVFSHEEAIKKISLDVPHTVHLARALGLLDAFAQVPTIDELAHGIAHAYRNAQAGEAR